MLKTFWTGVGGWADQQLPDGTIVWTAPSSHIYKTLPGSRLFFPAWNTTTAKLPNTAAPVPQLPNRGLMMPKRRHTRAADRAKRIQEERELNAAQRAEWARQAAAAAETAQRNKPPPPEHPKFWEIKPSTTDDDDPPPF